MTGAAERAIKRMDLLDKLAGVLRGFRNAMSVDGSVVTQEYVAWWGGLTRAIVGDAERGRRDLQFTSLRQLLLAYNVTWVIFGDAMDDVDRIPIVAIDVAPRSRREKTRLIAGRPLLRPLAMTLYDRRIVLGQSQEAMAYMGGLDRGFIGMVERAERSVGFIRLRDVLATYRLTWREFGQELHLRDPIKRHQRFPSWPGSQAAIRGEPTPPWGPAADRAQGV